ncbi:hypothetical protein DC345_11735 [Paenibacillus taichungensis]|uniref:Uncharacterized protein n=1 Tax=Paenibacillus taichungensis TaxID=484184 RepID=A0A329QXU0_9BACL|nr:polymorphic toxin type 44 domain-containing protein [Paenibacillus taichungensis]RAW16142.1 hypothetical protein DC345_11735 [Paenibacillus taichungensis]
MNINFLNHKSLKYMLGTILAMGLFIIFNTSAHAADSEVIDVSEVQQLHEKAKSLELVKVVNGAIDINEIKINKDKLEVTNENAYQDYLKGLESTNLLIEGGYAYIDDNNDPQIVSEEKIQKLSSEETGQLSSNEIKPFAEILDLKGMVNANRAELSTYYWNVYYSSAITGQPLQTAIMSSALWFKGKVQARGPWDYKTQPGWGGASKQWYADTHTGRRYVTTEYIGNYNYGFTGQFLFPLTILFYGGQYANGNIWSPEDMNDRAAIQDGFNDATR